jgi:hypothetical protein
MPAPGIQALVNGLMVASIDGGRAVAGAVVLHDHYCLWSTLAPRDTAALYQHALHALLPHLRPTQSLLLKRRAPEAGERCVARIYLHVRQTDRQTEAGDRCVA